MSRPHAQIRIGVDLIDPVWKDHPQIRSSNGKYDSGKTVSICRDKTHRFHSSQHFGKEAINADVTASIVVDMDPHVIV